MILLVAGLLLSQCCAAMQHLAEQPINTTSGIVTGQPNKKYPQVAEYLGIRFGETTAGASRFMPPKRYYGKESITATKFGNACPQGMMGGSIMAGAFSPAAGVTQSEDCLFINIWTKSPDAQKKKPVMLWIYGGGYAMGDSSIALMNGASLANNQDVIVVSFNYRINVFGFPGAPGLEQLNPGLLDQRMAAEWTRDNIAAFGGDPARITLFGESAGATSTDYYAYAWAKDPIVNAFIMESGSAMTTDLFKPASKKSDSWFQLSKKIGCGGPEVGERSLECIRGKTMKEVLDSVPASMGVSLSSITPPFVPTADEKTVFSNVFERAKAGDFAQKVAIP
jgi:cholinesterase